LAGKKIKHEEEAISEILVADTDLESGAEGSLVMLNTILRQRQGQQQQKSP